MPSLTFAVANPLTGYALFRPAKWPVFTTGNCFRTTDGIINALFREREVRDRVDEKRSARLFMHGIDDAAAPEEGNGMRDTAALLAVNERPRVEPNF